MKIEKVQVCGFDPAFRGMRNPKDSWERSDSEFYDLSPLWPYGTSADFLKTNMPWSPGIRVPEYPYIGPIDMKLACELISGGSVHAKFLRQIIIWADLTLPRYCWQEVDTYKISTVRNSCSTMHKLGSRELTQDDFELPIVECWLNGLNELIREFQEKKDQKSKEIRDVRRELKNALPEGFLQKATYMMSYETALAWLRWRGSHRLDEWNIRAAGSLCKWVDSLPYMAQFAEAAGIKLGG